MEQRDNVYVYHCNDAGFQTNFDKLVFEIEFPRIKEQREQVDDTRKSEQTRKTNGLQKVFRVITAKLLKI